MQNKADNIGLTHFTVKIYFVHNMQVCTQMFYPKGATYIVNIVTNAKLSEHSRGSHCTGVVQAYMFKHLRDLMYESEGWGKDLAILALSLCV